MNNDYIEIERKFFVNKIPQDLEKYESYKITQVYISKSPAIRLRKIDDLFFITFKYGKGIKKKEFECEITKDEFNALLNKAESKLIEKTRYLIPLYGKYVAELDIYDGFLKGFVNVEVEFSTLIEAENFILPDWFGKDITNDVKYSNSYMSFYGLTDKK